MPPRAYYKNTFWISKPENSLVRGYIWKVRMYNGAIFELWTPKQITRKFAKEALLYMAHFYDKDFIERFWKTKG